MKIMCLSFSNSAEDKKAWSGTVYKVCSSIKDSGCQVDFLCCKVPKTFVEIIVIAFFRMLNILKISSKRYLSGFTYRRRNNIAKMLSTHDFSQHDYVFIIANSVIASAYCVAKKNHANWPDYIYLADSTFSGVENYYSEFSNLFSISSKEANAISKHAFENSYKSIVSSLWTKENCIKDYSIPNKKIEVIEFGANIDDPEMGKIKKGFSKTEKIHLLLSGVDWKRKGGEIAVLCAKKMIADGYNITLHIAGMNIPPKYSNESFIVQHGFLNKNIPDQYDEFVRLLKSSDILLFPSMAECSAIALCEAAGFGLPVICFDTGGLANYVRNNVNGIRLPLNTPYEGFASTIEELIESGILPTMSQSALDMYNSTLNWAHWKSKFSQIVGCN